MKSASHGSLSSHTRDSSFLSNADSRDVPATHKTTRDAQKKEPAENANAVWLVESATWFLIILTILLGLSAGYLLWAKLTSAWPFPQ